MASGYPEWTSPRKQDSPPKRQRVKDLRKKFEAPSDKKESPKQGTSPESAQESGREQGQSRGSEAAAPEPKHGSTPKPGPSTEYLDGTDEQDEPSFSNILESTPTDDRISQKPSEDVGQRHYVDTRSEDSTPSPPQKEAEPETSGRASGGLQDPASPTQPQETDGSTKDGSPKDGSPKDESPKDRSPKDGSPKDGSTKDGSPKDGSPKDGSPKDGSPKDGSPKDESSKDESSKYESSKDEGINYREWYHSNKRKVNDFDTLSFEIIYLLGNYVPDIGRSEEYTGQELAALLKDFVGDLISKYKKFDLNLDEVQGFEIADKIHDHKRKVLEVVSILEKELEESKEDVSRLNRQLNELYMELEIAEETIEDLKANKAAGNDRVSTEKGQKSASDSMVEYYENEIRRLKDENNKLRQYLVKIGRERVENEEQCMRDLSDASQRSEINSLLKEALMSMLDESGERKPNAEDARKLVDKWYDHIQSELKNNKAMIDQLLQRYESSGKDREYLASKCAQVEDEVENLKSQIKKKKRTLTRYQERKQRSPTGIENLGSSETSESSDKTHSTESSGGTPSTVSDQTHTPSSDEKHTREYSSKTHSPENSGGTHSPESSGESHSPGSGKAHSLGSDEKHSPGSSDKRHDPGSEKKHRSGSTDKTQGSGGGRRSRSVSPNKMHSPGNQAPMRRNFNRIGYSTSIIGKKPADESYSHKPYFPSQGPNYGSDFSFEFPSAEYFGYSPGGKFDYVSDDDDYTPDPDALIQERHYMDGKLTHLPHEEEMEDSVFLPDEPGADKSMKKYRKQLKYRHILPTFGSDEGSEEYYDFRKFDTSPVLGAAWEHDLANRQESQSRYKDSFMNSTHRMPQSDSPFGKKSDDSPYDRKKPRSGSPQFAAPTSRMAQSASPGGRKSYDSPYIPKPHFPSQSDYNESFSFFPERSLNEIVRVNSPGRDEPLKLKVELTPMGISESVSGEHVICDIALNMEEDESHNLRSNQKHGPGSEKKRSSGGGRKSKSVSPNTMHSPGNQAPKRRNFNRMGYSTSIIGKNPADESYSHKPYFPSQGPNYGSDFSFEFPSAEYFGYSPGGKFDYVSDYMDYTPDPDALIQEKHYIDGKLTHLPHEEEMDDSVFLPDEPGADTSMKKYRKQLKYRHILPTFGSDEGSEEYYDFRKFDTSPVLGAAWEHDLANRQESQSRYKDSFMNSTHRMPQSDSPFGKKSDDSPYDRKKPHSGSPQFAAPTSRMAQSASPGGRKSYDSPYIPKPHFPSQSHYNESFSFIPESSLNEIVTVHSPGRDEPLRLNIELTPMGISESVSGEHVICDIALNMQDAQRPIYEQDTEKKIRRRGRKKFEKETPPVTSSRARDPRVGTPTSVFTKRHHAVRNLFDAKKDPYQYKSPARDTTIEWEQKTPELESSFDYSGPQTEWRNFSLTPTNGHGEQGSSSQWHGQARLDASESSAQWNRPTEQAYGRSPPKELNQTFPYRKRPDTPPSPRTA